MAAQMKVSKWQVEPAKRGDIEVSLKESDDGPYVEIIHAGDRVWIDPEDVPALIEALQAAAAS